jgi:hypothetical protein
MVHIDPGSAVFPIVKYLCSLAKNVTLQRQCKYFKLNISPNAHGACHWLGSWTSGYQVCNSDDAKRGFMDMITKKEAPKDGNDNKS